MTRNDLDRLRAAVPALTEMRAAIDELLEAAA